MESKTIKRIIIGVGISLLASFIFLLIYASILSFTDVPESSIAPVVITITGISILIGSIIGSRKITKNGIINGAMVGLVYILIIYLISSLLNGNFALNLQSIIMIVVAILCGVVGGIIGVNKSWKIRNVEICRILRRIFFEKVLTN